MTVGEAAEKLGVSRMTVWRHMQRLGIEPQTDAYDARIKNLSQDQYEALRDSMKHIFKRRAKKN